VQFAGKPLLGQRARMRPRFADDYRYAEVAGDEQRLIAKLARVASRIDDAHTGGRAAVAAREHVKGDAALLEQRAQRDDEWSLPRAADREIPYAHDRALQAVLL